MAAERADAVLHFDEIAGIGGADVEHHRPVAARCRDRGRPGARLGERGHDEVRGGLNGRIRAADRRALDVDVLAPLGEHVERCGEARVAQRRGVHRVGHGADRVERRAHAAPRIVEMGGALAGCRRCSEPDRHREARQPLLRAVMKIALQACALCVGGSDNERPRGPQPLDGSQQLRAQPLVVEREPRRPPELFNEPLVVEQAGPVQRRAPRPRPAERASCGRGPCARALSGSALRHRSSRRPRRAGARASGRRALRRGGRRAPRGRGAPAISTTTAARRARVRRASTARQITPKTIASAAQAPASRSCCATASTCRPPSAKP